MKFHNGVTIVCQRNQKSKSVKEKKEKEDKNNNYKKGYCKAFRVTRKRKKIQKHFQM